MHPLTPFAHWGEVAPYRARLPRFDRDAIVFPVRSKTGLVAARQGALAHLDDGVAAIINGGRVQFGARFLCAEGSKDVAILTDARAYGDIICAFCVDAKLGPGVYRCYDAGRRLIYIGSSGAPLKRQKGHESRSTWWPEVADVRVTRYPTLFEARGAERLAIIAENPVYNKLPKRRGAA